MTRGKKEQRWETDTVLQGAKHITNKEHTKDKHFLNTQIGQELE